MIKIPPHTRTFVFNQFLSLGDILFLVPMARHYMQQGYQVIWPLDERYAEIQRHFPDIQFIPRSTCRINLERRDAYISPLGFVLPLRWAEWVLRLPFKECMPAKYKLMGLPVDMWRGLTWCHGRDMETPMYEYNFINHRFRADRTGYVDLQINNGLPNIELIKLGNYSLLDWAPVLQHATTIHTVSTSLLYMIEVLPLAATEIHLYTRKPDEPNLDFVRSLLTKKYILHE